LFEAFWKLFFWQFQHRASYCHAGLGFFLIKFENRDDFEDVLRNGPWFIGENFISIRPWVPDFRASDASVSSVAVWVRLPELPVEYYHKDSLMHIGSGIGPVLRVDFNTASGARGRFARLCLQLDLDKPLIRTVRVGKLKLAVVYEGIGLLCFKCGKLGHKQEWCPAGGTAESSVPHESAPATSTPEENSNGFGPWMLVTRRKRQTKSVSQQVVVDTAERGRTIAVHNVPSVEVQVGDDGTAAIKVDNYPTRGKEQGKGKETKLLAGGASQKVLKGQGGPPKTNRGPRSIVTPPTQNLNSLQSSIPSPYIHLEKPKELKSPVAPSAAPNTSTSSLPHTELISHSISLRPHTPSSSSRNDKHQVGLNTDPQGSAQLVNPSQRENHSNHGGYYRPHSEGPSPCLGMVQREPNTRLGRDHSSSPTNRLSRTPSPNRFGMASGSQPVLEFHDGYTANRRDPLSFEDSFTAVAGAPIKAISGGGVQCNTNRVRREESITITPTLPRMEGECILDQTSSDSKVCTQIRDSDQKFRIEGSGFSSLPFKMAALMNTIWEIWPEKAWNSLEAEGSWYPTLNPPFMSAHEIGLNVLTWNCRGVLNPCFRRALLELLHINDPAILILTETRLGGARAAELAKSFPFDGFLCTNTIGFAGGIWILWKSAAVELELLTSTEQEIHVSAQVKDSNSLWLLSAIYASPRRSERRVLWKNLMVISGLHKLPWVMVGDFNDIISGDEKWGGNFPVASRIAEYNNCMNTCSMLDLGFSGPKYTWSNGQDISTLIMQRLDRAWVNSEWRILFPEAYVTNLTRTHSDHCPILLSLWPSSHNSLPRPFRFENIWLSHPEFPTVVDKAWSAPCPNLLSTFELFTSLVTTWNKNTFGNIFQRKKRILARINGMQCALATNPSEASARLEKSLRMEYGNILKLEEDFWALKSRVGWVVEGDRNTKFFHTTTLVRRRYNKIVRIRNNMGDWIVDSQLIRNHIQQGFIDLFSTSHVSSVSSFSAPTWAPCVSAAEALNLTTIVLPLEIKESLWSLKPFKAPGPDGLHPGFFQHCWHQVGESVSKEVIQVFNSGKMPSYLNRTLIILIPKCLGPETLSHFRPISLCNTVYKIVTKIIVSRIRPILNNLISPYQTAFVPGRRGVDNVIIAQELIHTIQKKKGRLGHFILKIDLEKAYDRIEWSFIREVLILFKFPMSLVQLILECISSSSCAILYNGGQMDFFQPTRGIRQGDPLSPYIFILCMEYLSLKIFEACNSKTWKPIKASRRGPAFSHLFFADDLLLCAEASTSCCLTISRVLEDFCCVSGQKINLSKSKAFFSPNVSPENRISLCDILRVSSTPDLGRYLGFPLNSSGRNTRASNFIVERVQAKLSNWKAKLLSPAGRLVLIQAVTSAVPAYYMQSTALPTSICSTLDRINRNFLWGSSEEKKKMHMVGWDKICRAKSLGGLGLYACKPRNVALLAKLNWRLLQEKDALWARTILAKYSPNGVMEIDKRLNRSGSSTWRGIKKGHEVFRKGLRWVVRNGQGVSFWHDKWVGETPIRDVIHRPLLSHEDSFRVCDVVEGVGNWDLSRVSMIIPKPICDSIRAILVCPLRQQEDCIAWDSRNGDFCLKLAYLLACKPLVGYLHDSPSNWIWKVPTSPRIRFFLWQCYHNSVPVRDTLVARGINIPNTCPRCLGPNESLLHVLRDCPDSSSFWHDLNIPSICLASFSVPLIDWLKLNCSIDCPYAGFIPWNYVFSFGIWNLWLRRNIFVFNSCSIIPDPVANTIAFASELFCLLGKVSHVKVRVPSPIKWKPPDIGWAKLNTDGASLGNPGIAGGGGIIRDSNGGWVGGFARAIGVTTSVQAELRALKDGLMLAIDLGIPNMLLSHAMAVDIYRKHFQVILLV
jgi:exonuclease III